MYGFDKSMYFVIITPFYVLYMEIQEGELKKVLEVWIDSRDTRAVDDQQCDLTEEFLAPNINAIITELTQLRKAFDVRIKAVLKRMLSDLPPQYGKDPSLRNPGNYPVGFCDTISDGVWVEILKNMRFPETPGMRALSYFSGRGGHLKQIAGIQHGKHFQNALQAGSLFVDVANNTVDKLKPPVEICDLTQSGFNNMDDFAAQADVIEQYWGDRIFAQRVFPFLTPFYPIVHISKSGRVELLPITQGVIAKNIFSDFKMAEDFISRSRFAGEELPARLQAKMEKDFSWDEDNYDFDSGTPRGDIFYRGGAPDDLIKEVFERLRNVDQKDLPKLIGGSRWQVRDFNHLGIKL